MRTYHVMKTWYKLARWRGRRIAAGLHWGFGEQRRLPAVLGNAMPKSGSHLIIQVLQGLTRLGPFVNPGMPPVNRAEDNKKLSDMAVLSNIRRMAAGDIGYGYVGAQELFVSALTQPGRATIFVYRDPRDMIISQIFYATTMHPRHWMRSYYSKLPNMEARINAAIQGVSETGSELTPVRRRYETYLGWLDQPAVLSLRFEDLILERQAALERILDYISARTRLPDGRASAFKAGRAACLAALEQAVAPKKSGTFRKGQPGNWREHFTPGNIALFKEHAGDLLLRLGYEQDHDW
jgi:plasmid stabilization system protein ParE